MIVVLAGPNGAGKSTFYEAFLSRLGLRFINADVIAKELEMDAYSAAKVASRLREELVSRHESFVFETVLSDPQGEKVDQLTKWQAQGYTVTLCFIGVSSAAISKQRVAMRVSQGGHDVPNEKIKSRYPRVLANLGRALGKLQQVHVYDNSNLCDPYRRLAVFEGGRANDLTSLLPAWFSAIIKDQRVDARETATNS